MLGNLCRDLVEMILPASSKLIACSCEVTKGFAYTSYSHCTCSEMPDVFELVALDTTGGVGVGCSTSVEEGCADTGASNFRPRDIFGIATNFESALPLRLGLCKPLASPLVDIGTKACICRIRKPSSGSDSTQCGSVSSALRQMDSEQSSYRMSETGLCGPDSLA
jgi:hypothetical protein